MDRDDTIKPQQLPLPGFAKYVNCANDLKRLGPERCHEWRIVDRDMVHRNHIRLATRNVLAASDRDARQAMKDAAKNNPEKRPDDPEAKRHTIWTREVHLVSASTCSKTWSAVSSLELRVMASSAARNGATSRVESMRSRSITL